MNYLCNGLSLTMMRDPRVKQINEPLTSSEFVDLIHNSNFRSCIGHQKLSECLSKMTGKTIQYNRRTITLNYDDTVILVSLNGRLPEHPSYVEYKSNLVFNFVRFEKQSTNDITKNNEVIEEVKNYGN